MASNVRWPRPLRRQLTQFVENGKADVHTDRGEWRLRAHTGSVKVVLRAHAARIIPQLLKFFCRSMRENRPFA